MAPHRATLDEDDPGADAPEPPRLKALRIMVMALTGALILGVLAVAAALVIRVASPSAPSLAAFRPEALQAARIGLPQGEAITALGASGGALMIATTDAQGRERLRLFDAATGAQLGELRIERE